MRREIILCGEGGQGLLVAGAILAEAAGVVEFKEVVQTQSYGIQARGGSSQSTVIISRDRINFPEVISPSIILALSQEAYSKYSPSLRKNGLLIFEQDLVKTPEQSSNIHTIGLPFTAEAENLGNRIVANTIALAALSEITGVVSVDSLEKALLSHIPHRNLPLAIESLKVGAKLVKSI